MKCKECKYWKKIGVNGTIGECNKMGVDSHNVIAKKIKSMFQQRIKTLEDFGCIHFESEE